MAFLQKKPTTDVVQQFYQLQSNKTALVVGLGNIGKEYDGTRHNVGFAAVDFFTQKAGFSWVEKKDLKARVAMGNLGDTRVICVEPTTMMNLSGQAVQAVMQFYKLPLGQLIVVHDELDIPFGQLRLRTGGSAAGHNGIKNISQMVGDDYGRIRVGIGPKLHEQQDSADFVLARFSKEQEAEMPNLVNEVNAILNEFIFGGELPNETRSFI